MVGVSIVGNVFGKNEVKRIVECQADGSLPVIVVDGYGVESLEKRQVLIDEGCEVVSYS